MIFSWCSRADGIAANCLSLSKVSGDQLDYSGTISSRLIMKHSSQLLRPPISVPFFCCFIRTFIHCRVEHFIWFCSEVLMAPIPLMKARMICSHKYLRWVAHAMFTTWAMGWSIRLAIVVLCGLLRCLSSKGWCDRRRRIWEKMILNYLRHDGSDRNLMLRPAVREWKRTK